MAMDFFRIHLGSGASVNARRAWFLQDDAVVVLAANISSTSTTAPVTTSLDQRPLARDVLYVAGSNC